MESNESDLYVEATFSTDTKTLWNRKWNWSKRDSYCCSLFLAKNNMRLVCDGVWLRKWSNLRLGRNNLRLWWTRIFLSKRDGRTSCYVENAHAWQGNRNSLPCGIWRTLDASNVRRSTSQSRIEVKDLPPPDLSRGGKRIYRGTSLNLCKICSICDKKCRGSGI